MTIGSRLYRSLPEMEVVTRYMWRATLGFGAVTSVAVGQAVLHEQSYVPLPELTNARKMGLELPKLLAENKKKALDKVDEWKCLVRDRLAETTPRYRVLFIGDSLVNGVGGDLDEAGPALPRRMCRALADKLNVQVEWRALGVTGGDLNEMREKLVPMIDGSDYDVVVVMCGLNDFKYLARGEFRTPWTFREDLLGLLDEIRTECGDKPRIVLPALPVALTSFSEPLRSYVIFIANMWDQQKQRIAELIQNKHRILFVDTFEVEDEAAESSGNDARTYVAKDGVHPNESGYELWAQHIANKIYKAQDKSRESDAVNK